MGGFHKHKVGIHRQVLLVCLTWLALFAAQAQATSSSLSRWLSKEAIPDIVTVLDEHPRTAGQTVRLVSTAATDLDSALSTVLASNLGSRAELSVASGHAVVSELPGSIDALQCASVEQGVQLRISVQSTGARRGRVELALVDGDSGESGGSGDTPWRRWLWQGAFSSHEREALADSAAAHPDGSLRAPWPSDDIAAASRALSIEFACALRPQVKDHLGLAWPDSAQRSAQVRDTFNASRHLLGSLRELGLSATGQLRIETRVQAFDDELLQLWLHGVPAQAGLEPVQAVTYIRRDSRMAPMAEVFAPTTPTQAIPVGPVTTVPRAPAAPTPGPVIGPARDFFDVQLLGASQSDRTLGGADLSVQLLLENRGDRPIEYAFSVSGGHYLNCVARPQWFRHDRYGYLEGEIAPGQQLTRVIQVRGVGHSPNPLWGARKCAGFSNLEGFENFRDRGYRVTEFLRWAL